MFKVVHQSRWFPDARAAHLAIFLQNSQNIKSAITLELLIRQP